MKKKHLKKVVTMLGALMVAMTFVLALGAKTEAKAFDFFDSDRISIKKCAITLKEDKFEWTGEEIEPQVRVNYKGTDLEEGVDYVLSYSNNVDAGTQATIKITGKGNYKSSQKVYFTIKGIDIEEDCIINIEDGDVKVYYNGRLLMEDKNYWVNDKLKQSLLVDSIPVGNKFLNTYQVTQYYTVYGKGQFSGVVTKTVVTTERLIEDERGY